MSAFTTVIGLEVHVQLATDSKLFSSAPSAALGEPNTRVSFVDLGLPGVLPRPNERAIALAVRAALALGCEVQRTSRFARKHYFYPDLPKGYQISQYHEPLALGGSVPIGDGRRCRLHHVHVEEDAGKLVHTPIGTLVDLNRAGMPLIEIVGEPDLRAPAEAHAFLSHLRELLRHAGVGDCDLELGSMRCDANISLMPIGSTVYGTKVELKNLNSLKMVQRALEYEERRQTAVLAAGGRIQPETRSWHDELGESRPMRSKESAPDYRYLSDPDLPPLTIDAALLERERAAMGELPDQRRERYRREFGLAEHDVEALVRDREVGEWFERVVSAGVEAKTACNWIVGDVLPALGERSALASAPVSPTQLAELVQLVQSGELTRSAGQRVLQHLWREPGSPRAAMRALGLGRIADEAVLEPLVRAAVEALPEAAEAVQNGKERALDALKGHVMRATRGRADPTVLDTLLRDVLARSRRG